MAVHSRESGMGLSDLIRIVVAIALGLGCLSAVIAGGSLAGRSLSALMERVELVPPEAVNPLR